MPGQPPRSTRNENSPDFFDFGGNAFRGRFTDTVGYAGFRIHYPINKPDVLDEVVVFLGVSYFRAVPKDMTYGLSARGLALDTAVEKREEEFPAFTKFWLRRPERFAKRMTIYAMLEGRNVTGAYQFTVEPGVETRMHVRAVLFFRKKAEHAGYAPMTSMYWFGEDTATLLEISARKSTIRTAFSFSVAMARGCGIRWHGRGSCSGVDSTRLVRAPLFSKLRLDSGS
jgi:glucan biosynthesis protein